LATLAKHPEEVPRRNRRKPRSVLKLCNLVSTVVRGIGNSRGEVVNDPGEPLKAAQQLGAEIFIRKYSDYSLGIARTPRVWLTQ
jgi:hypothetical protein